MASSGMSILFVITTVVSINFDFDSRRFLCNIALCPIRYTKCNDNQYPVVKALSQNMHGMHGARGTTVLNLRACCVRGSLV